MKPGAIRILGTLLGAGILYLVLSPSSPTTPASPPRPAPVPLPPGRTKLVITNVPGSRLFTLKTGDILSVVGPPASEAAPTGFVMTADPSLSLLGHLDDTNGFGPVGPNDFLLFAPGVIRITYPDSESVIEVKT